MTGKRVLYFGDEPKTNTQKEQEVEKAVKNVINNYSSSNNVVEVASGYDKWAKMPVESHRKPSEALSEVLSYPCIAIPHRGLTKQTCEYFGVRSTVSETDGETVTASYFPYYDQSGQLCGFKKRDWTKPKNERGHFTAVGHVGVDCKLFGQNKAEESGQKRLQITFVEGEAKCMAAWQASSQHRLKKGNEYDPVVVSLSCGTANCVAATTHNEAFLRSYDSILLGMDADSATPEEKKKKIMRGVEANEAIASTLMTDNLYVLHYPSGMKDADDCILKGFSDVLANLMDFPQVRYKMETILSASDIGFELFTHVPKEGAKITSFPKLQAMIRGIREYELTILTAPSNAGKSYVVAEIAWNMLQCGKRVGYIGLEERKEEVLQRFGSKYLGINFGLFKENPLGVGKTTEQLKEAYDYVTKDDKLFVVDHFGSMAIDTLMERIKHLHLVCGCDFIVLDHLSMVISGLATDNERKELDMCMTQLAAFCAANPVHILAVSHLNRSAADEFKAPKGKEDEPFWIHVRKEAMRGSAALEQLAWNIFSVEVEVMPDRSRGRARIVVLKSREHGKLGISDTFTVDPQTGEFVICDEEGY